jgi:FMN-dependent NADH-azoreductase
MSKLLFIQASPRSTESKSLQIAQVYLEALRSEIPGMEVDTLDLWEANLPSFDGDKAAAKINVFVGVHGIKSSALPTVSFWPIATFFPYQCGMAVFPTA